MQPVEGTTREDRDFVDRLRAGDIDAVAQLWRVHRAAMVAICVKYLGDSYLAEDAADEALLRAWDARRRLDPKRPLGPWLHTIAARHCVSILRHRAFTTAAPLEESLQGATLDQAHAIETRVDVSRALSRVSQRHQRVLLAIARGDSLREISAAEGLSVQASKSLSNRARLAFRTATEGLLGVALWVRTANARRPRLDINAVASVVSVLALAGTSSVTVHMPDASRKTVVLASAVNSDQRPARASVPHATKPASAPSAPARQGLQPEDVLIVGIEHSPSFEEDGTVFMVGITDCDSCGAVLFRSTDRGSTFEHLPAVGLLGEGIALPPNFGHGDDRIFATSRVGLQASTDGGMSFVTVAPVGPLSRQQIAFDPRFGLDQQRIVLGGTALLEYYAGSGLTRPRYTLPPGRWTPAFTPDGQLLVSGVVVDLFTGAEDPVLFRCGVFSCLSTRLNARGGTDPTVQRLDDQTLVLRHGNRLGIWDDAGDFEYSDLPTRSNILAMAPGMFVVVQGWLGQTLTTQLWNQVDGQWAALPVTDGGAPGTVSSSGNQVIISVDLGIRCSNDRVLTWEQRC